MAKICDVDSSQRKPVQRSRKIASARRQCSRQRRHCFGAERAMHAARLARFERQHQLLRLKGGGADRVDGGEPDGGGVGDVDARERLGRNRARLATLPAEPAQANAQPPPQQRRHRLRR
jgi:hypothetical protein